MVDKLDWNNNETPEHLMKIPGSWLTLAWEFSMIAMDIVDGLFFKSDKDKLKDDFYIFTQSVINNLDQKFHHSKIIEALRKEIWEILVSFDETDMSELSRNTAMLYECYNICLEMSFLTSTYLYNIPPLEKAFILWMYNEPQRKNVLWFLLSLLRKSEYIIWSNSTIWTEL